MSTNLRLCVLALIATICTMGCGGPAGPKTFPAGGRVMFQDKPVVGATVTFVPSDGMLLSFGVTDAEGKFTLKTRTGEDGAPLGTQHVTVSKAAASGAGSAPVVPTTGATSMPTGVTIDPSGNAASNLGAGLGPQASATSGEAVPEGELPAKYNSIATSGLQFTITEDPAQNNFEITLAE